MTQSIFGAGAQVDPGAERPVSRPQAAFGFDVDGTSYEYDQPTISGGQIMFEAGIYPQQGLIQVLHDGSRVTVGTGDTVNLAFGATFKRRPRFKRG